MSRHSQAADLNGDGTFADPEDYPTGDFPTHVEVVDVNDDGIPDVLTSDFYGDLTLLLGYGNGTFAMGITVPAGPASYCVAVANLNDGMHKQKHSRVL